MDVADTAKQSNGFGEVGGRSQDYAEIDDGFRGKAWDCGAADVLDVNSEGAESLTQAEFDSEKAKVLSQS